MSEQGVSTEDFQQLQQEVKNLKLENQQLSAALLLIEQLISAFAVDLDPRDRIGLIHNINTNFTELGAADTIPLSPVPSRPSTALKIAQKLHQMSKISEMFNQNKEDL